MKLKLFYTIGLLILLTQLTFAHEYWFEPDSFFLAKNEKTAIHLFVGEGVKMEEERPFQLSKTVQFNQFSMSNILNLKSLLKDEALPIYNFSGENDGNYLLALERNWSYIKLEPQKFEDYLHDEGMTYISAERKKLGETQKEGRERYSRFIKTLLQVGNIHDAAFGKVIGLKNEIIALENPYTKKVGDSVQFKILFDGKPLVNKEVFADNRKGEKITTQKLMTDKNGKITVKIDQSGLWLVRLVYMQRCKTDCSEADWESFWSAFSFGVR